LQKNQSGVSKTFSKQEAQDRENIEKEITILNLTIILSSFDKQQPILQTYENCIKTKKLQGKLHLLLTLKIIKEDQPNYPI
jgi:predicted glycosyltransferase